jgi:integrase/recombinase XerC
MQDTYYMSNITLFQAKTSFMESIRLRRSASTIRTYAGALEMFLNMLESQHIDVTKFPVANLSEDPIADFISYIKNLSPSTEVLYLQIIKNFYEFLDSENLAVVNLSRVRSIIRQRSRRSRRQSVNFPEDDINRVIEFMANLNNLSSSIDEDLGNLRMRDMRDRALILTFADTGLRVNEVCKLRCGDVDWKESRAIITSRGKKQAPVRFSTRAKDALKDYLSTRAPLDLETGRTLSSLPLFARHDKGAGKKIKPITTTTCRNIVTDRVRQILGDEAVGSITPNSFLHYFVTAILRATGNLKLAQELARHANIQVTQRYAHLSDDELDRGYYEIFERPEAQNWEI